MKPYARNNEKLRINNRRKFGSTRNKISWECSPRNYPCGVAPLSLVLKRIQRIEKQGLTKKQRSKYADAML